MGVGRLGGDLSFIAIIVTDRGEGKVYLLIFVNNSVSLSIKYYTLQ